MSLFDIDPDTIPEVPRQNEEIPARICRVIDGDTFVALMCFDGFYFKTRLRLSGIDTPEVRTKNALMKKAGLYVKEQVEKLILNKIVTAKLLCHDKFGGRIVSTVCVDKKSLAEILLECGMAKIFESGRKIDWTDDELSCILTKTL